ncbi:MAG: FecR family protein [Flavobacteriales bacterium]
MNEQFDILLPLILAGEADTEQEKAFFELLERNEALQAEYRAALSLWLSAEAAQYDAEKALQQVRPAPVLSWTRKYRPAIAAAVLFMLGMCAFMLWKSLGNGHSGSARMIVLSSGNQVREVKLPDGSRVWLNRNSELRYPEYFAEDERLVQLKGEAYFDVAKDPGHPFITETGGSRTRVLGTEFNLAEDSSGAYRLMVTEGKVAFGRINGEALTLTAGQAALLPKNSKQAVYAEADPNTLAWRTGQMTFDNDSLPYIIRTMQHVYGSRYVLQPGAENLHFTGTLRALPETQARLILSETLHIVFSDSSGYVYVSTKP